MKEVLIVGGGFAGLQAAKTLGNRAGVSVTLLDRRNYHLFQPLLYQVAMAGLSPAEIAVPIRSVMSKFANTKVLLANVENVDLQNMKLMTDIGEFKGDYIVLACGAKHSYFGHNEWEEFAPGLKTLEQATEIRRRILMAFELAEEEADPVLREKYLTFVVVGGGPTGVELAGAIGEISHFTLARDFKNINPFDAKILLIEAGDRILKSFAPELSAKAVVDLKRLGVEVRTNLRVSDLTKDGAKIDGGFLSAQTILWAAGVEPSSLNRRLPVTCDEAHRVIVNPDLSIPGFPNIFVLGDQAHCEDLNGKTLPGLAPVALQQGKFVGELILRELKGKPRGFFRYFDKGQLATIGRKRAVMEFKGIKLTGMLAWLAWLFVHIYYLIGFKNRLFVLFQWAWYYFSFGRGARLILHKEWRSFPRDKPKQR